MTTPFIGQITLNAFDFAPRNYAFCSGQLLPIQQNQALFSILGTTYGGNGVQTFALPDLRGRVPMHWGSGPGLSNRSLGEVSGTESVTLLQTQMPAHTHIPFASSSAPSVGVPTGNSWATGGTAAYAATANTTMASGALNTAGSSQAHENRAPILVMNYCIALFGIFPSRN